MEIDLIDIKDASIEEFKNLDNLALSLIESIFSRNNPQNEEMYDHTGQKENLDAKYWLSSIIAKYSEKIELDQKLIEKQRQEVQDLQMSLLNFEEQNSFLKDMYEDAQGKMNQLQAFLDESETNNEVLQERVFKYEARCKQFEALKEPTKKSPIRSASVNSNLVLNDALIASKKLQEEIESKKGQIQTLQETVELQEGLIEKLQVDVGKYIDLEEKYEQLKRDLSYLFSLKVQNDEVSPELMAFSEKLKFDRKSISLQNEPSIGEVNKNVIEKETYPINKSVSSSDEEENLNLLAKGQSISPSHSKSFRRQKSLAEDLRSTKVSEELKGVSPFNRSRVLRPKPVSQVRFNSRSNDFTNDLKDGFQGHKHTKTVSTFETDGYTPELRSPDNNVIESDIEEEFLDVFENSRDLSEQGSYRGKALMRWLDEADPKISEKDVESPISVKSRQTVSSVESQKSRKSLQTEKINIVGQDDKMKPSTFSEAFKFTASSSGNTKVKQEIDFSKKIDLKENTRVSEIPYKSQKDLAEEVRLYIQRERMNAKTNTKFSVLSLLKVMVFGLRHEK